jgi:hypothetical protein
MMINDPEIRNLPEGMKKDQPFSVPEGYFANFPSRIMDRLSNEKKQPVHLKKSRILKPWLAMAAALAAIILVGYLIIRFNNNEGKTEQIQDYADVIDYYIYDFDDETISAVFNGETDLNYLNNIYKEDEIVNYLEQSVDLDYSELQDLY